MPIPMHDAAIAPLLSCLPQPAFWLDDKLEVLACNELAETLGEDSGSLVGASLQNAFETDAELLSELSIGAQTFRVRGKKCIEQNGDSRVLATLEDISQLARAREESLRYQRMAAHSLEGFWEIDSVGNTTFVNKAMTDLLGYPAEEMMGRSLFDFMDDEARAICEVNMARRASGIAEYHEFRLRHKDGSDVWTIMSTHPYASKDGEYAGGIALVSDASERHRLDRKIAEAQRLESLTVLASGVAHDFNNILVGILCSAELGLMRLPKGSELASCFDQVLQGGRRAALLSQQMLAYAGGGPMRSSPTALNQLVDEMSGLLHAATSQVSFTVELGEPSPWSRLDAAQIRQVIVNLVANAAEACDQDGSVSLRTGTFEAGEEFLSSCRAGAVLLPGTFAFLEIEDNGCGIDEAELPRIFDPFFSTKFVGRGLGLAAVHGLLKAHRAGLHLWTETGKGTCVRLLFAPCATEASLEDEAASAPKMEGRGLPGGARVLVVDDEPTVLATLERLLRGWGYECELCSSGEAGLQAYDAAPTDFDLAIVDMTMPGMSGPELKALLRDRSAAMPILLSSGYHVAAPEDDQDFHFLRKPYDPGALQAALRDLANK